MITVCDPAAPTGVAVPTYLAEHCRCPIIKPHITPGSEIQFWLDDRPHRIPADRNGNPTFGGEIVTSDHLARRLGLAGVTGWDWRERVTRFIVLDYDGSDHAAGHDDETLQRVIDAARRLGYVSVRRSKGGRGVHLLVILSEPMPAATGKAHQANAAAIVDRMCRDADFDFRQYLDCAGVVAYVYAPADQIAENGYTVIVEASTPTPIIEPTSTPTPTGHAPTQLTDQHKADMRDMEAAGYVAHYADGIMRGHTKGFAMLGRPGYQTNSPGQNPKSPNAFAYPTPDGGWIINRYGVTPDAEAPGWTANRDGFASCRIDPPLDLSVRGAVHEKPTIQITTDEQAVIDSAVAALSSVPGIYQRARSLVHIAQNATPPPGVLRSPDTPVIASLPMPTLRERLSSAATWIKYDGRAKKPIKCRVPEWVIGGVAARGKWPVPVLEAIAETPYLRPDGTIASEPGYDPTTGVYLHLRQTFPSVMPVDDARSMLLDIVCDFPFATEAHKSAWLAAALTPFARLAYPGPSPLFAIDANVAGSGKSMSADGISIISTGRPMARMTAPSDDAEWRKLITSIAIDGQSIILLDNVEGTLGSAAFDAALTSDTWSDRILGRSETVTLPLSVVWFATSNNVALKRDTARRTLHIRLDCRDEHPEQRTGFRYPDLLGHVKANRAQLAMAALSILYHYCQAGRPDQNLTPWGSFEGWSDLVRSSIVWAGMPDAGETRLALAEEADTETQLLKMLIAGWEEADPHRYGLTTADAIAASEQWDTEQDCPKCPTLRAAVGELCGGTNKRHALGLALRKFKDRVVGGVMFDSTMRGKINAWRIASNN